MIGIFDRFKKGRSAKADIEKVMGCARYCFNSPEGRILIEHLVEVFEVDDQVGYVSGDEAIYINGKQDGLKYILALLSEKTKGVENE